MPERTSGCSKQIDVNVLFERLTAALRDHLPGLSPAREARVG